jgi:serine phosphatase RsbU (regulator of sigma subunit)
MEIDLAGVEDRYNVLNSYEFIQTAAVAPHCYRELELARQTQARLSRRRLPGIATVACDGICLPAGEIGGDYYDFLEVGPGRLGVTIADVSGKGAAAGLQMANLQADIRSRIRMAAGDLHDFLISINRSLYENTPPAIYASLVFADYCEHTRRLRYVNCGHPAALVLHPDNSVERLESNAPVLGLWKEWDCSIEEISLCRGDTLLLYTDGVTEATNKAGDEFGEDRLVQALKAHTMVPVSILLRRIVDAVREFSGCERQDDMTVAAARCGYWAM